MIAASGLMMVTSGTVWLPSVKSIQSVKYAVPPVWLRTAYPELSEGLKLMEMRFSSYYSFRIVVEVM